MVHRVHIVPPDEYIVDAEGGDVTDLMDDIMSSFNSVKKQKSRKLTGNQDLKHATDVRNICRPLNTREFTTSRMSSNSTTTMQTSNSTRV